MSWAKKTTTDSGGDLGTRKDTPLVPEQQANVRSSSPTQLDYEISKGKTGYSRTIAFGIVGIIGGYILSAVAGLIFIGGPQGPLPFIFTLWPVSVIISIIWGRHLDRRRH